MSNKVLALKAMLSQDDTARFVSVTWDKYHQQRSKKIQEWLELRNYVFATDTTTTTVNRLPWKNSTTIPKLCQIRDNLHSNYISALFPNDNWLQWEAYTKDSAKHSLAKTIEGYIDNKCREGHFRSEVSKLLYDYIDYGNAFCIVSFENNNKKDVDGTVIPGFIGPRLNRISPLDIVFNPLASSIDKTHKIIRSVKTLGELAYLAQNEPEQAFWQKAIDDRLELRKQMGGYRREDFEKAIGYAADGFGNMWEYFNGDTMEILEFYGDYYDNATGTLTTNQVITVCDRRTTVRSQNIDSWLGSAPIYHVGWRFRQDNLWAMGPLDNLVGMQYRIDHLENLKADAMDLIVHPPLGIAGEVEEFVWGPGVEIHISEGGSISPLAGDMNGMAAAKSEISDLEARMELYAGAPREAMGIRTPGEKTAFEVQSLENAAGRIFEEKIGAFETELMEPALNGMLESARRNMDGSDVIRVLDDDLGIQQFLTVTKSDITASGILRPVGARHFAQQSQDLQNIVGIFNSQIGQMVQPHTSALALTEWISDRFGLKGYDLFQANVAVSEQAQTNALVNQAHEDQATAQKMPIAPGA